MKLVMRLSAATLFAAGILAADVTYTQSTKFLGGTMIDMVQKMASMPMMGRMMGGNSMKQAFEDQQYNVYVKGNKMARLGRLMSTIYDLDAGTITSLDNSKQTYTTTTFAEMQQRMEEMQQRMNRGQQGNLDFDIKVSATGETRTINDQTAKEMLIIMTAKQASAQGQMVVTTHAWLTPFIPPTKELVDFQRKLGEKYAYAFSSMGPGMASAGKGMSEAMKEAVKQDGYPVMTQTEITGMTAGPMGPMGSGNSDPNAPLIKMEADSDNFAQGAVDDSKFVIPAGYKEGKHPK